MIPTFCFGEIDVWLYANNGMDLHPYPMLTNDDMEFTCHPEDISDLLKKMQNGMKTEHGGMFDSSYFNSAF